MNLDYFNSFNKKEEIEAINNNVWSYTRVSSKEQFDNNSSILVQEEAAKEYAFKNGYHISKTFGGTYESAKGDFTRKEFKKLIDEIKKNRKKPFAILIFKVNRFSRSGSGGIAVLHELIKEYGVHLIEVSSGKDTTTDLGEYEIMQLLLSAKKENMSRLDVTIPGMKSLVKRGDWLGKAPRGYTLKGKRVVNQNNISGKQIIVINEEGKILKKAWRWKLEGKPDFIIINNLKRLGLIISKQSLSAMWRKPFYCGISTHKLLDGQATKGNWSPIVSEDDFKTINTRFESANNNGYKQSKFSIGRPLQSHLYCESCGGKITGYKAKGKYDYYKCQTKKCCSDMNAISSKRSQKKGLNDLFMEYIDNYQLVSNLVPVFKEQMRLTINQLEEDHEDEKTILNKNIKDVKEKIEKLEKKYIYDDFDKSIYLRFKEELTSQLSEYKERKNELDKKISNLDSKIDSCADVTQNISKYWASGNIEFQNGIQKLMFPKGIVIDPKNRRYRTKKINAIFELSGCLSRKNKGKKKDESGKKTDSSCLVAGTGLEPATSGL